MIDDRTTGARQRRSITKDCHRAAQLCGTLPGCKMIDRLFLLHPRSLYESYGQHWRVANRCPRPIMGAGLGCVIHGFISTLFTLAGSRIVKKL